MEIYDTVPYIFKPYTLFSDKPGFDLKSYVDNIVDDHPQNNQMNTSFDSTVVPRDRCERVAIFPIFNGCLLIYRKSHLVRNGGYVSTPGGRVIYKDESLEAAAVRIMQEKTSIKVSPQELKKFATNIEGDFTAFYIILKSIPDFIAPDSDNIREIDTDFDFRGLNGAKIIPNTGFALAPISCIGPWLYRYNIPKKGLFLHFLKVLKNGPSKK